MSNPAASTSTTQPSTTRSGNQKPSELYYKMANLANSIPGIPKSLVFNRWVNKLPTNAVSFAKALEDHFEPDKHLKSIDDLVGLLSTRAQSSSVSAIAEQNTRPRSRTSYRARSRSNSRGRTPRRQEEGRSTNRRNLYRNDGKLCFYHFVYGREAEKCGKPKCPMKRSGNESQ